MKPAITALFDETEWRTEFLEGRREKIISGKPYIDFDWDSLKQYLPRKAVQGVNR